MKTEIISSVQLMIFQFKQIFIYWILGAIVGALFTVFAGNKISEGIGRIGGKKYIPVKLFLAALLGTASPLCMYGTIPLIYSLMKKNIPQYLIAAFMISSILLNPNLFMASFALGVPAALLRLLSCILAGIIAGVLVKCFFKNATVFNFEGFGVGKKTDKEIKPIIKVIREIDVTIVKTAPYFIFGIFLTALFDRYFPKELLISAFSNDKGFGVLLAASLGIPIYVCGGGTIPLIYDWLNAGMSMGSAVAFMLTGPATKLTNLSAVKSILGARNFTIYIVFNIVFAVVTGLIINAAYSL